MILRKLIIFPVCLFLVFCVFIYSFSRSQVNSAELSSEVSIQDKKIVFTPESKLFKKLEIVSVKAENNQETGLKAMGQIIALVNKPTIPGEDKIDCVELDPSFCKRINLKSRGLHLGIGDAFGVVSIPVSYSKEVHEGDKLLVSRYGVSVESKIEAEVSFLVTSESANQAQVIFQLEKGQTWLPGMNCVVTFQNLQNSIVKVATTALLHEGAYEYVLKETGPYQFIPQVITIGEGTPDEVDVIQGLAPDDKVAMRGAILLKPVLHELLQKEAK